MKVIGVFDIGKTNKKILLFDQALNVVYQHEQKFKTTVDEDGSECDDIQQIRDWIINTIFSIVKENTYDIQAVNFSTYGASLSFLNKKGQLLTPIYNYLKKVDSNIQNTLFLKYGTKSEFCRKTASPALGQLLNSGIQILWLKQEKKNIWNNVDHVLHFPQYLSYVLTKKICSEPTSIGCHTFMWDFDNKQYHSWVKDEGIKLPQPVNNSTVYTSVIAEKEIKTGVGIHDSSASLVPYLENSKQEFILISTGTWCINMNPFNHEPLTKEQLNNDCLCFLTPKKEQVKSSRLFMGHFHEVWVQKLNSYFNIDPDYYRTVNHQPVLLDQLKTKFSKKTLFFSCGTENLDKNVKTIDLSVFNTYDEAYSQMVIELTKLCIHSINLIIPENDKTKIMYISGGFARNAIFVNLLSDYFSTKNVFTSEIDNASALGAALAIAENIKGFDTTQVKLVTEIEGQLK